jgi:hypothetical protein
MPTSHYAHLTLISATPPVHTLLQYNASNANIITSYYEPIFEMTKERAAKGDLRVLVYR